VRGRKFEQFARRAHILPRALMHAFVACDVEIVFRLAGKLYEPTIRAHHARPNSMHILRHTKTTRADEMITE
jgi:hypothetical protein